MECATSLPFAPWKLTIQLHKKEIKEVTDKLKRILSDADHHKVLDIGFCLAFFIGSHQLFACINALNAGAGGSFIWVLTFQMLALTAGGGLAYAWHIQGKVFQELAVIPMIVTSMLTVIFSSIVVFVNQPLPNPFYVSPGGMAAGLLFFLCMEMEYRFRTVNARRRQIRISERERKITANRSPEIVLEKVKENRRIKGL